MVLDTTSLLDECENTLFRRENPRGLDVALAINTILKADTRDLPLAVTREQVLAELMVMQSTKPDGEAIEQSAAAQKYVASSFWNTLTESSVFQSGYERFEAETKNNVVPVTDYFFRYIYQEDVRTCLDAMLPIEITQSLPKRPSTPIDADGRALHDSIESENGTQRVLAAKVGKVAGVVVFKSQHRGSRLLTEWLSRKRNLAFGVFESLTDNLEHHRGSEATEPLRDATRGLRRDVQGLLPRNRPPRGRS